MKSLLFYVLTVVWMAVVPVDGLLLNASIRFQPVLGSGAAFTSASSYLFMTRFSEGSRSALFQTLFGEYDVHGGAQFTAMRICMGTSDFSVANYTYDDLPEGVETDFELDYFSIAPDQEYIIPAIKAALAVNPDIRIVASPWSAPAWMKVPQTLFGGNLSTSLAVRQTYAKYFRKFVEAYMNEGIPIFAVTVQNEPRYQTGSYPSMLLSPEDEIQLSLLIAAELEKSTTVQTKVLVYDHNWDDPTYPIEVLSNASVLASDTIIGSAFHCYAGNVEAQLTVQQAVPSKRLFFTECCGGAWAPNFQNNLMWDTSTLVLGAVNGYAETVTKWNMALDEHDGPHLPSACTNCWGLLTVAPNGTVTFREDFYPLAHLNMWLSRKGDNVRVGNSNTSIALAMLSHINEEQPAYVVVLLNNDAASVIQEVSMVQTNSRQRGADSVCSTSFAMPPYSVATVRWPVGAPVASWVLTSGDQVHLRQRQVPAVVTCVPAA